MGIDTAQSEPAATIRPPKPFRPIVAFDFDGTLTWRDSFLAFLAWRAGPARYAFGMARLAPATLALGSTMTEDG